MANDYKVIFLDIDGVLNNDTMKWDKKDGGFTIYDPSVEILNVFLDNNEDVFLVLSSDWRKNPSAGIDKTIDCLKSHGFRHADRFIGETPTRGVKLSLPEGSRWLECRAWLEDNSRVYGNVTHYVCLDDSDWHFVSAIKADHNLHVVITDYMKGLTPDDMSRVEKLLNV